MDECGKVGECGKVDEWTCMFAKRRLFTFGGRAKVKMKENECKNYL